MSKTLYRLYRPKEFSDVLGQDHIIKTLQNAITSNRIGHAYLFTGPRGTGKTTVARLFATAVNTTKRKDFEPVSADTAKRLANGMSMDVIEIDAASSTSVEGIRTLRETVAITPSECRYKVYIIDEVHMLSTSAFNALLKTLEEPPAHVIFILATTEIHKVPDTILSRCQRFDFARFGIDNIMTKLRTIAKAEKITISDEALEMIALTANGGMRDAESLLAQVFALEDKNVTAKEVAQILGTTTSQEVINIISAFTTANARNALLVINAIVHDGYNLETFIRSVIEKLRIILFFTLTDLDSKDTQKLISVAKSELDALKSIAQNTSTTHTISMIEECITALQKTKSATIQQLPLEIAAINICKRSQNVTVPHKPVVQETPITAPRKTLPKSKEAPSQKSITASEVPLNTLSQDQQSITVDDMTKKTWDECLTHIEIMHKPIAQILAQCTLSNCDDRTLTMSTTMPFYKERILQPNHRTIIEIELQKSFNRSMRIEITVIDKVQENTTSEILSYATQLMGGVITNP